MVLDLPAAWIEDEIQEMRVGNILMRNIGPCIRCNTIRLNLDKCEKVDNSEPYKTLGSFRTLPQKGCIFGNYYQMSILNSQELYEHILPAN